MTQPDPGKTVEVHDELGLKKLGFVPVNAFNAENVSSRFPANGKCYCQNHSRAGCRRR